MSPRPAKKKIPSAAWSPDNAVDRENLRVELDRLLNDDLFRRSARYSSLLQYVVEKTLDGDTGSLKERTIGTEVFKRPADYDTNADPVVRFCASEVRKRLAQYYRGPNPAGLEIELPLGTYIPKFYLLPAEPDAAAPSTDPLSPASLSLSPDAQSAPGAISASADIAPPPAARRPWVSLAWAAVILCVLASAALAYRSARKPDPQDGVWGPLLESSDQVQICTGTPPPDGRPLPDTPDLSIKQRFIQPGHKVSFATASVIGEVSAFLKAHNRTSVLSEADTTTVDNLRNHPLVLINANNNQWTLYLVKPLRFHFLSEGDTGYIIDAQHPERRDWKVDFTKPYLAQTEDYALVARFLDPTTHAPVLIIAGIGSNGTQAAGDFVTSPASMADLGRLAPKGWEKMSFEAILKVQVVQGRLGATEIASTHFWK